MSGSKADFGSQKAFGGKAALSFEKDRSKPDAQGKQEYRVSVQGAPAIGPQQYDWAKKIVVQLSPRECAAIFAVLMGDSAKFEASQHGLEKDKTFAIEIQSSGVFFAKVMQKQKGVMAVPIAPQDVFEIAALVFGQIAKNYPDVDAQVLRDCILQPYRAFKRT